jgi:tetratricopeptide (TPR) repeat protein
MSRIEQLRRMWDADQTDADVPYMIAQEHASAGDHGEALTWYDRCLGIDPDYHYAYFHKARALEAMGRTDEAVTALRAGLEKARDAGAAKAADELAAFLAELGA